MNRVMPRQPALGQPETMPDLAAKVDHLLRESDRDDLALITPSVYETARLVSVGPWFDGHAARVRYLCAEQAIDGGWGVAGFRLVPTLSATECLLTVCERKSSADLEVPVTEVASAASRGLGLLRNWPAPTAAGSGELPDTVAIELIVPRLITLINERLAGHERSPLAGLPGELGGLRLRTPDGTVPDLLDQLRQRTATGKAIPGKLWHTWETLYSGRRQPSEVPLVAGSVSCSPAATAAWLGAPAEEGHPATVFVNELQGRWGGPVPVATPMPYFERSWILAMLGKHGLPHTVPAGMLAGLGTALTEHGIGAGPGLAPDADDTAVVLYALGLNGVDRAPDSLMLSFDADHFLCYPEERTPSPTTNAHAIEALACRLASYPEESPRYGPAMQKAISWLIAAQNGDGSWTDKWHGSPYYATACCAQALAEHGGAQAKPAVERAVRWVIETRHPGGRWGHGQGTVEETAHAALILALSSGAELRPAAELAIAGAWHVLIEAENSPQDPHLWIGKDMYTPLRIADLTRLVAIYSMTARRSAGTRPLDQKGR